MDNDIPDRLKIKLGKYREAEAHGRFAIVALVMLVLTIAATILIRALV
jgi:hypothetical protein